MKQTIMPLPAGGLTLEALLSRVWPVGAVYMSLDATSQAQLFGGTVARRRLWRKGGGRSVGNRKE